MTRSRINDNPAARLATATDTPTPRIGATPGVKRRGGPPWPLVALWCAGLAFMIAAMWRWRA